MAEGVVSFVAAKLGDFIIQEGRFLSGVTDQVKLAQTELQLMRGFLKDADTRQRDQEIIRIWVAEIRDAVYDLEDVIETFALKVASKRRRGVKNGLKRFACILNEGADIHKIGAEIASITTKISSLRASLQAYDIREVRVSESATSSYERQQQLRRTYSHIVDRDVVGLEGSVEEIVMHLMNDENCHRVVSIWGMGGLGKTTLAKQVYHHNEVRHHFDSFAWVCISQRCQVRDVWEGVLVKLVSATNKQRKEILQMRDDEIAKRLYFLLQAKRCLVVLDDIWSIEAWDSLKAALPYEETKSKILLTTRREAIALHADRNGFLHQPQPLNDSESWKLFEKIAIFGRNHDIDSEIYVKMRELGAKMLRHCAGLPLAINVLAGLLAKKNTIDEWEKVYKNVYAYIRQGKGHEEEYAGASWLLALSYDDLPYHLKPCFLYFGHFPVDFEISVKRLTQLWIAEGFISLVQQKQGLFETMEDVAYSCLSELVERCVVQIGERGSIRKIKTCRIHDVMRDLCLLKAEEENFLQIVNFSDRNKEIGKVRRLAILLDEEVDKLVPDLRSDRLRSLLYFSSKEWVPKSEQLLRPVFEDFKLLRVLKLEDMGGEIELPAEIGKMVHLRFLSLRDSAITRLPSSLGNLVRLQTLDFHFSWSSKETIPNVIWKMEQLRHLYLLWHYRSRTRSMLKLSTLSNLQTLTGVSIEDCDFSDFSKLTNLRKLAIGVLSRPLKNFEEILRSASSTLDRIQSLYVIHYDGVNRREEVTQIVLRCRHAYKLELYGPIEELPAELQYHPNLTKLSLTFCRLKEDQMRILEKLPNLRTLVLVATLDKNTKALVCSTGGFVRLEFLSLRYLEEIEEWRVEEGAMPNLSRLHVTLCYGLKGVPDGLRYISTLKELTIDRMPRTFYSRLQEGGEDFYKIKHVPSLVFGEVMRA